MKRTRLRRQSTKTRKRNRECREFRQELVAWVRHCEVCGHDPTRVQSGGVAWSLVCHEIARGPTRLSALDQSYAVLVVCFNCHQEIHFGKEPFPEAKQLACLKLSRPQDYDLQAYNALKGRGPNRITEEDVEEWL